MSKQMAGRADTWPWVVVMICVVGSLDLGPRWGPIVGVTGGLIGAAAGVYWGVKRTPLPQERRAIVRLMLLNVLLMAAFAASFLLLPGSYRFLAFVPFGIGLFLLVRYGNRRRRDL